MEDWRRNIGLTSLRYSITLDLHDKQPVAKSWQDHELSTNEDKTLGINTFRAKRKRGVGEGLLTVAEDTGLLAYQS